MKRAYEASFTKFNEFGSMGVLVGEETLGRITQHTGMRFLVEVNGYVGIEFGLDRAKDIAGKLAIAAKIARTTTPHKFAYPCTEAQEDPRDALYSPHRCICGCPLDLDETQPEFAKNGRFYFCNGCGENLLCERYGDNWVIIHPEKGQV